MRFRGRSNRSEPQRIHAVLPYDSRQILAEMGKPSRSDEVRALVQTNQNNGLRLCLHFLATCHFLCPFGLQHAKCWNADRSLMNTLRLNASALNHADGEAIHA